MNIRTWLKDLSGENRIVFTLDDTLFARTVFDMESAQHCVISTKNARSLTDSDALDSASIEGAHTTLAEIYSGKDTKDIRMVKNVIDAWLYLRTVEAVDIDSFIHAWRLVVGGCCDNVTAGADGFRTGMVYVGCETKVVHTPAKPNQIVDCMSNLFSDTTGNPLLDAIIYHYYIAYIHPFCDGNGRVARLMCNYMFSPMYIPQAKAITCRMSGYYTALQEANANVHDDVLDITPFVTYMLQRLDVAFRMYKLYGQELSDAESMLLSAIDKMGRGFVSVDKAAKILNCPSGDSVRPILQKLVTKGFLVEDDFDYRLKWR